MTRYPYLDFTCAEIIQDGNSITLYCRCGHTATLTPAYFRMWSNSSLHKIVARSKCTACGAVGDVPQIRVVPVNSGGFGDRK